MYILKSNPSDGSDDTALKSSKPVTSAASATDPALLARLQAPIVPVQVASLSAPSPVGIVLGNLAESVAMAGLITSIGQPANQANIANEKTAQAALLAEQTAEQKLSQDVQALLASAASSALPISSLADTVLGAKQAPTTHELAIMANRMLAPIAELNIVNLSLANPVAAPVTIAKPTENATAITVIGESAGNVRIVDFKQAGLVSETFVNTGLGVLTINMPATNVSSLSLSGKVEFTATGMEVTSGITVSGESDVSNVTLFITGGAQSALGSKDVITLGDGNNFVFNAGDGAIYVNLGAGANGVILAGIGASGAVSFATNDLGTPDFVAIAANGLASPEALAAAPLVTISGLNAGDAISFLSDSNAHLTWAGGSAQSAQVQAVANANSLAAWIAAAQSQTAQAHSIAWFHFDGATYILESAAGPGLTGDTLVRLTGTVNLTDSSITLSQGLMQFVS